ncbi:MAG: Nif3-like dinuclear metal center hexameric protein [Planctomycetota bacterium]
MTVRLEEVLKGLRAVAPERLAEPWDKVGLCVGDPAQEVSRGLLCIDLTEAVVAEAVGKRCELVVAYHPPIFKPLERVTAEGPWTQRRVFAAMQAGLAVYSPHTALDAVRGGTNDWLCDGLGAATLRGSIETETHRRHEQKVVTFVPRADADRVRQAMSDAGGGGIGNYSSCSFNADGVGTFYPEEGAKPAVGELYKLERVEETRIEMICYPSVTGAVLRAIREAHPYEEPAIDVFDLADSHPPEDEEQAAGRVVFLKRPITPATLATRVKKRLGLKHVKLAAPEPYVGNDPGLYPGKLTSVAVCVGSGGSLFEKYGGADAYVTGEMQYHQVLDFVQRGKVVVLAGHTDTERPYLPVYRDRLRETDAGSVDWHVSEADRAPLALR